MIDGKTAELLACACHLGALYSGASAEAVAALTWFGRYVGLAFQIADDLLDLVGDEQTTGKSLGTDLEQQKMTLPLIRLMQQGPAGLAECGGSSPRHRATTSASCCGRAWRRATGWITPGGRRRISRPRRGRSWRVCPRRRAGRSWRRSRIGWCIGVIEVVRLWLGGTRPFGLYPYHPKRRTRSAANMTIGSIHRRKHLLSLQPQGIGCPVGSAS